MSNIYAERIEVEERIKDAVRELDMLYRYPSHPKAIQAANSSLASLQKRRAEIEADMAEDRAREVAGVS
jgi:hypothetical protein